jgi:hypothetical protein
LSELIFVACASRHLGTKFCMGPHAALQYQSGMGVMLPAEHRLSHLAHDSAGSFYIYLLPIGPDWCGRGG